MRKEKSEISIRENNEKPYDIPLGDCIKTDIDNEGNFNGFLIRPDVAKMIMWRDKGKLD